MPKYRIKIEYDGSPFCGWQRQADQPSVQQAIEEAIFGFSGESVGLTAAGRTDTGVHALGQVAHFELSKDWEPNRIREAVNYHLKPQPVCVHEAAYAEADFSARFSAKARHYRYHIINRRPPLTFDRGRAWHVKQELDATAMDEAAKCLLGTHDFTTFRHVHCQAKSPVKSLDQLDVEREGEDLFIEAAAPSFLHNQVRSLVGSLVRVGDGHWTGEDLRAALEARDRKKCGPVAPPEGLYLVKVDY